MAIGSCLLRSLRSSSRPREFTLISSMNLHSREGGGRSAQCKGGVSRRRQRLRGAAAAIDAYVPHESGLRQRL